MTLFEGVKLCSRCKVGDIRVVFMRYIRSLATLNDLGKIIVLSSVFYNYIVKICRVNKAFDHYFLEIVPVEVGDKK